MAKGRPKPQAPLVAAASLDAFTAHYLRATAPILAYNTIRSRDYDYRTHISPALGHLDLADVSREVVVVWLADLASSGVSRRALVESVATLRVILAAAVEWGRIPRNPAARLPLPPPAADQVEKVERVLTLDQLRVLADAAGNPRTETIIRAAGEAGLRRGEIAGLRWPDVDLPGRRLQIRRQVVQERLDGGGHRKCVAPTLRRRARNVAISDALAERLADLYETEIVEGGRDAAGYVWVGRDGGPMNDRSAHRVVQRACIRAGLVEADGETPLTHLHGLRHTAASIMLLAGLPLLVVSRQLGHASVDITARTYAHLVDEGGLDVVSDVFSAGGGAGRGDAALGRKSGSEQG